MDLVKPIAFLKTYWKFALILIAVAGLCSTLGYCEGKKAGRAQMQLAVERANTKALLEERRANELAAAQRLTDTIAVNRQEEALRDAIAEIPDTAPDAVRIRLGCERLRAAGTSAAALPAVCRPGG